MSKDIDSKVVSMSFDNTNFEKNVKQSINTLDQLKESLKFDNSEKSLDKISNAIDTVKERTMSLGEKIKTVFSDSGALSLAVVNRYFNQIADIVENTIKGIVVEPISEGWGKYESKLKAVATLLAQGFDETVIEDTLEEIAWFADETSYSFQGMINTLSKFTAQGYGLEDSKDAMEGIAEWAAIAGQNATTATGVMEAMAKGLGAGFVNRRTWQSVMTANMDNREFREIAIEMAKEAGILVQAEDDLWYSINSTLSEEKRKSVSADTFIDALTTERWLTNDVLMSTLKTYTAATSQVKEFIDAQKELGNYYTVSEAVREMGDELDPFGKKALLAAQEARTFGDVIDSIKDAVSTKWGGVFEQLFGNYKESVQFWTDMSESLYSIFAEPLNQLIEFTKAWHNFSYSAQFGTGYELFRDTINTVLKFFVDVSEEIDERFTKVFGKNALESLYALTLGFNKFFKTLMDTETVWGISNIVENLFYILKALFGFINSTFGTAFFNFLNYSITSLRNTLESIIINITFAISRISKDKRMIKFLLLLKANVNRLTNIIFNSLTRIGHFLSMTVARITEFVLEHRDDIFNFLSKVISLFTSFTQLVKKFLPNVEELIWKVVTFARDTLLPILLRVYQFFKKVITGIIGLVVYGVTKLIDWVKDLQDTLQPIFDWIKDLLTPAFDFFAEKVEGISNFFDENFDFDIDWEHIFEPDKFNENVEEINSTVQKLFEKEPKNSPFNQIKSWAAGLVGGDVDDPESGELSQFEKFKKNLLNALNNIWTKIINTILSIPTKLKEGLPKVWEALKLGASWIIEKVSEFFNNIFDAFNEWKSQNADMNDNPGTFWDDLVLLFKFIKEKATEAAPYVLGAIKKVIEIIGNIIDYFGGIDGILDKIKDIAKITVLFDIDKWLKSFTTVTSKLGSVFGSISNFIGTLRYNLDFSAATKRKETLLASIASFIKSIAVSILIIAAAMMLLSCIDPDTIWTSAAIVGSIMAALIPFILIVSKMKAQNATTIFTVSSLLTGIATVILMIGITVAILTAVVKGGAIEAKNATKILIGVLAALAAFIIVIQTFFTTEKMVKRLKKVINALMELAIVLILFVMVIKSLAKAIANNPGAMLQAFIMLTLVLLELCVFLGVVKKQFKTEAQVERLRSVVVSLVILAAVVYIFAMAIKKIAKVVDKNWVASLVSLGIVVALMAAMLGTMKIVMKEFTTVNQVQRFKSVITSFVTLAGAIAILAVVLIALALVPWQGLLQAGAALVVLLALFVGLGAIVGKFPAIAVGLQAFSIAFAIFAVSFGAAALMVGEGALLLVKALEKIIKFSQKDMDKFGLIFRSLATGLVEGIDVLINALPTLLESLAEATKKSMHYVTDIFMNIIIGILESLEENIALITDGLFKFIIVLLDQLVLYGPEICDKLIQLLIDLLYSIKDRIKEIVEVLLEIFIEAVDGLTEQAEPIVESLYNLMDALTSAFGNGEPVVWAEGTGILGLLTLISTQLALFSLGTFGASSLLPAIADNMSSFSEKILPFCDNIKDIPPDIAITAKNLGACIMELATAGFINAVSNILSFGDSLPRLGNDLTEFAPAMVEFSRIVSGLDEENIANAAVCGVLLSKMVDAMPKSSILDSFRQMFTGSDGSKFELAVMHYGAAIGRFSEQVENIHESSVTTAANAGYTLAQMMSIMPTEGGLLSWFTGSKQDMVTFGENIVSFGQSLVTYSDTVSELHSGVIERTDDIAYIIKTISDATPEYGGLWQLIFGTESPSEFGLSMANFAFGMKNYIDTVCEVDKGKYNFAIWASDILANKIVKVIAEATPEYGLLQLITGTESPSEFGLSMAGFAQGMKGYVTVVNTIGKQPLEAAVVQTQQICDNIIKPMTEVLPDVGLLPMIMGMKSPSEFGTNMKFFAQGFLDYATKLNEISGTGYVEESKNVMDVMREFNDVIPNYNGILDFLTKKIEFENFKNNLVEFGKAFNTYSDNVKDIPYNVIDSTRILTNCLTQLSTGSTIDQDNLAQITEELHWLVEFMTGITTLDLDKMDKFSETLATFALNGIDAVIDSFSNNKQRIKDAGKSLVQFLEDGIEERKKTFMVKLGLVTTGIITAFENLKSDIKTIGTTFMTKLADGFRDGLNDESDTGLKKALQVVNDFIEDNLNLELVITPVLNMENVNKGLNALDTLISGVTPEGMEMLRSVASIGDSAFANAFIKDGVRKDSGTSNVTVNATFNIDGASDTDSVVAAVREGIGQAIADAKNNRGSGITWHGAQ